MSALRSYSDQHQARFLDELFQWLRIPSVSADPQHTPDVRRAADWLMGQFRALGCDRVELWETAGHPSVFAELRVDASAPTILVYGHYDVQPADPLHLWTTPAFEPAIREERIYARGATDDKGQSYMHLKAVEALKANGGLPCNVKFFIEGEEEVGSANLAAVLNQHKEDLTADVLLISDTSMVANDVPSIAVGLRGLTYMEVEVTGPNRDLHSGVYGGAVDNPIHALARMIASLHDADRRITIHGFYDDVREVPAAERAAMAQIPFSQTKYNQLLALPQELGETGYSTIERATIRPTLEVNGIWGGYTGEGAKTVLPSKAHAKISMRLVPDQDPDRIAQLFTEHLQRIAPPTVRIQVKAHHGGKPFLTSTDSTAYRAAEAAMAESFGKQPIPAREGGSIPILALFEQVLGMPTVLMGFGLDMDAPHSPDESYGLFNYFKGIETIALYHKHFRQLSAR